MGGRRYVMSLLRIMNRLILALPRKFFTMCHNQIDCGLHPESSSHSDERLLCQIWVTLFCACVLSVSPGVWLQAATRKFISHFKALPSLCYIKIKHEAHDWDANKAQGKVKRFISIKVSISYFIFHITLSAIL